jgi:hypothetical protein
MEIDRILAGQCTVTLFTADCLLLAASARALEDDQGGATSAENDRLALAARAVAAAFDALAAATLGAEAHDLAKRERVPADLLADVRTHATFPDAVLKRRAGP